MTPVEIIRAAMADLTAEGIEVVWVPGWETRGRPYDFTPAGAVDHHTATKGYQWDYPSLGIVRDGRSDLPGPLSQFGIGRTGPVYVIAAGYANHAGPGGWRGLAGNSRVWGASEAENDGIGEPISAGQARSRIALHVALARHTGYGADMICLHREWSSAGKVDPTGVDGPALRSEVARRLAAPPPAPQPKPITEDPMQVVTVAPGQWVTIPLVERTSKLVPGITAVGVSLMAPSDTTARVVIVDAKGRRRGWQDPKADPDNPVVIGARQGVLLGAGDVAIEIENRSTVVSLGVLVEYQRSA